MSVTIYRVPYRGDIIRDDDRGIGCKVGNSDDICEYRLEIIYFTTSLNVILFLVSG